MIAVPITASTNYLALKEIAQANREADLIELRIDYLKEKEINLEKLLVKANKPVIVSNRCKKEGGKFNGTEKQRIDLLKKAVELKADYLDLEYSTEKKLRNEIIKAVKKNKNETKVILSSHSLEGTPSAKKLNQLFDKMNMVRGVTAIKIVCKANSVEDNFVVLDFLAEKSKGKKKLIAFCMGAKGKDSRILCTVFGSFLTYASLKKGKESAEGQLTAREMRRVLSALKVKI